MKKIYNTEVTDTLVAIGIISGFYGLMAIVAIVFGM
ncbi:hypothetical protein BH20BAC1_BH20BAC1_00800 [soil metagenome]